MSAVASGLDGRTALVTGGSRGIGRAIVERLAADGMDVTFLYADNTAAADAVVGAARAAGRVAPRRIETLLGDRWVVVEVNQVVSHAWMLRLALEDRLK